MMAAIAKILISEIRLVHAVLHPKYRLLNSSPSAMPLLTLALALSMLQADSTVSAAQESSTSPSLQLLLLPRTATALLLPPIRLREHAIVAFLILFINNQDRSAPLAEKPLPADVRTFQAPTEPMSASLATA